MKKILILLWCVFAFAVIAPSEALGQAVWDTPRYGSELPSSCNPNNRREALFYKFGTNRGLYHCTLAGIYELVTAAGGAGTVTSVGLSLPSIFTVTGSPVTGAGTLSATFANQLQNLVLASPSGGGGPPGFRALVEADIPALSASKITSGAFGTARIVTGTISNSRCLRLDGSGNIVTAAADCGSGGGAVSPLSLTASSASETPLTLNLAASQSANAFEVRDSSNNIITQITRDGYYAGRPGTQTVIQHTSIGTLQLNIDAGNNRAYWSDSGSNRYAALQQSVTTNINNFRVRSNMQLGFSSSAADALAAADAGLARFGAAEIQVTDGDTGLGSLNFNYWRAAPIDDSQAPINSAYLSNDQVDLTWKNSAGTVFPLTYASRVRPTASLSTCTVGDFRRYTVNNNLFHCKATNTFEELVTMPVGGTSNQFAAMNSAGTDTEWKSAATSAETNAGTNAEKPLVPSSLPNSKYLDQNGQKIYATTTHTGDAYAATLSPAISGYQTGQVFNLIFDRTSGASNSGAVTLNLNGFGAVSVVKNGSTALASGDLPDGIARSVMYDGTNWQIVGDGGGGSSETTFNSAGVSFGIPSDTPVAGTGTVFTPVANQVRVYLYYLDRKITVDRATFRPTTTAAGNASFAVYSLDGNTKHLDTGAFSTSAMSLSTPISFTAVTLERGYYYFAVTADNTTAASNAHTWDINTVILSNANVSRPKFATAANPSVAGVMPATLGTLTVVGSASFAVPAVVFHKN